MSKHSIEIENQGIGAEINQHRMMLKVKPAGKDLEAPILRPSRVIIEPTSKLLDENLFTQFCQNFANFLFRITFWKEVDGRLLFQVRQCQPATCGVGRVEPIEERLLRLHYHR